MENARLRTEVVPAVAGPSGRAVPSATNMGRNTPDIVDPEATLRDPLAWLHEEQGEDAGEGQQPIAASNLGIVSTSSNTHSCSLPTARGILQLSCPQPLAARNLQHLTSLCMAFSLHASLGRL